MKRVYLLAAGVFGVVLFLSSIASGASSGLSLGYGYIDKIDVGGATFGGQNLVVFGTRMHGDIFGVSVDGAVGFDRDFTIATEGGTPIADEANIGIIQGRVLVGKSFDEGKIYPYVCGGIGHFYLLGITRLPNPPLVIDEDGFLYTFGAGMEYNPTKNFGLILELTFPTLDYSVGNGTHKLFSAGVQFRW